MKNLAIWIPFWCIAGVLLFVCYHIDRERQQVHQWCTDHGMEYIDNQRACVDANRVLHMPGDE